MALWKCSLQLELYFLPYKAIHWTAITLGLPSWCHWARCTVSFIKPKGLHQEFISLKCMYTKWQSSIFLYCWLICLILYKINITHFFQFLLYAHLPQMTIYSSFLQCAEVLPCYSPIYEVILISIFLLRQFRRNSFPFPLPFPAITSNRFLQHLQVLPSLRQ